MTNVKELLGNLVLCILIAAIWILYAYFVVQPLMNVPLMVGGVLTLLGAIVLGAILAVLSFILIVALFN